MAHFKGSPSKSGELMWERHAWLLSGPKCTKKLHRLYPCHGHLAACAHGQPWHGTAVSTDLGAGKGAAGNLIEDLCPLAQEPNLSSGPCLNYAVGMPVPGRVPH